MRRVMRCVVVAWAALALLTAASATSGAEGDQLAGKTYADAAATVAGWGQTPVIATNVGGRLATDQCTVTSSQRSKRQIAGPQQDVVLLNLYCGAPVAGSGKAGNSTASATGRAAKEATETAAWCSEPEQAGMDACAKFCKGHDGMCTANF